jgi:beta-lactamase class A
MITFKPLTTAILATLMSLMTPLAHAASGTIADMTAPQLLERLLVDGEAQADDFAPAFLAAVPLEQVNTILAELKVSLGAPESISEDGPRLEITTQSHKMVVELYRDADGRINGLLFKPAVPIKGTLDDAVAALNAFKGQSALLVTKNGTVLTAHESTTPLAVGSAFKLGVLKELNQKIAAGEASWDQVVTLEKRHRSLSTEGLRNFPDGSPLTLHTVASLMISLSDNIATDMLMEFVGREAVSAELEQFALTTREFFQLKTDPDRRAAFRAADEAGKAEIVDQLAGLDMPPPEKIGHHDEGIEWYLTAEKLCALVTEVADLDLFIINPGVADPQKWAGIAFKGGSEAGVLNLTTHLRAENGDIYCVAYTLNDAEALPEDAVTTAYSALIAYLSTQSNPTRINGAHLFWERRSLLSRSRTE